MSSSFFWVAEGGRAKRAQRDRHDLWSALVTVAISQQATLGVAAVTPRGAIGAGVDLLRRLGLRACMSTALRDVYTAFFPGSRLNFRPDTTCSDTTFISSSTDMRALAARLQHSGLARLPLSGAIGNGSPRRSLSIVRLGDDDDELKAGLVVLDLPPDHVVIDHGQRYEVRVDETAMETIREHVRASVNGRTPVPAWPAGSCPVSRQRVQGRVGLADDGLAAAKQRQPTGRRRRPRLPGGPPRPERRHADNARLLAHAPGRPQPRRAEPTWKPCGEPRRPEWRSAPALHLELTVPDDVSAGETGSAWPPQIHGETFETGTGPADNGQ